MRKNLLTLAITFMIAGFAIGQVSETTENAGFTIGTPDVSTEGTMEGSLYSNGPYYNVEGTPNLSVLQSSLGLSTYGFGCNDEAGFRVADDWVVENPVNVEKIYIYNYQTGSTTSSTISYVTFQIWDGLPGEGTLIWGDEFDDAMDITEWSGAYRVLESSTTATDRPIMVQSILTPGLTLQPGTYWLDWSVGGTLSSGPWVSPITITGETETGNAKQFNPDAGWGDLADSSYPQGLPFDVDGSTMGLAEINNTSFTIYPNPTAKFLNVNAKNKIENIQVYNLAGQEVMKYAPNNINAALDVSSLTKGTYIIKTSINGKVQTQKFVKK